MLLHIGNNVSIDENSIIAIINKDTIDKSKYNKEFLEKFKKENLIINYDIKNIKSYIMVSSKENKINLYASNISTTTLLKRKDDLIDIEGKVIF